MDARAEFLRKLSGASSPGVPEEFASLFQTETMIRNFTKGSFLALEADECRYLPIVLSGSVRIYKASESGREITLYRIDAGQSCVLTANCMLNDESFPALAMVEETADVLLVPSRLFLDWMDEHAFWRRYVYSITSRRLSSVLTTVTEIAFSRMDARIAEFLRKNAHESGAIRITHQALADELGTAREVVSRILKDLEKSGAVALGRGDISILDSEALKAAAYSRD